MPALFECDDAGRLTASIPDPKGELHEYELRLVRPGDTAWSELLDLLRDRKLPAGTQPEWACVLLRLDTEASYFVCRLGAARWFCECSHYMYRGHKDPDNCKHCAHARSMYALTRTLTRSPQPQGAITRDDRN